MSWDKVKRSDFYDEPKSRFGLSGISWGPDAELLGKSAIKSQLARLMADQALIEPKDISFSFWIETEGSLSVSEVKPGRGRRMLYADLVMASVNIGITMDDLHLPPDDFRHLFATHILDGYDHLVPFLRDKKGLPFDFESLRKELVGILLSFLAITGQPDESWSTAKIRRFLKRRHPDLYEKVTGESLPRLTLADSSDLEDTNE